MADEAARKSLRWKCRRGMQELDLLLLRYVDQADASASDDERAVFLRLLATEDDKLWHWFMGHDTAPDADLDALVQRIRQLPA